MVATGGPKRPTNKEWEQQSNGYLQLVANATSGRCHATADDPENFELINSWLDKCTSSDKHDNCQTNLVDDLTLPARLLDIFPEEQNIDVKLVAVTDQTQSSRPGYAALSHRWGQHPSRIPKTTQANLPEMMNGISLASLPKTYQDAIYIARRLQIRGWRIRYLWIDSLCILQEDQADWEQNGQNMHKIYSMATCVIAASGSSGPEDGCFIPRAQQDSTATVTPEPCNACIDEAKRPRSEGIAPLKCKWSPELVDGYQGSLATRGWCFQERELARRILYFTPKRIFWCCRTAVASEDHPMMVRISTSKFNLSEQRLSSKLHISGLYGPTERGREGNARSWAEAIENYSQCELTFKSDKLPAVFGLASIMAPYIRATYAAGVWLNDFAAGVAWFPEFKSRRPAQAGAAWPPIAPTDLQAPSWSWASVDIAVSYPPEISRFFAGGLFYGGRWVSIHPKHPASSALRILDFTGDLDVFGRSKNLAVHIEGAVMELSLSESDYIPNLPIADGVQYAPKCYRMFGKFYIPSSQISIADGVVYFDQDVSKLPSGRYYALQLGKGKSRLNPEQGVYLGLVLKDVKEKGVQRYQRIGMFEVGEDNQKYRNKLSIYEGWLV